MPDIKPESGLAGVSRHLDLGCGNRPRNPYGRDVLHGLDIAPGPGSLSTGATVVRANVALEPIPFSADTFDSVSAYDFLEHVPRVLPTADGQTLRFPFVELMNEIWRVLKPDGLLYASTPCYPHPAVFQDPTHVNPFTHATHEYFTRPNLIAQMYGFRGDFEVVRVVSSHPRHDYEPLRMGLREKLSQWNRRRKGPESHVVWEFRAMKSA
jgi:SAM-dependent methyltransferase